MRDICEECTDSDCENCNRSESIIETNFDMVKNMNMIEMAAWVTIQIKKYYESDNTIIFEEEVKRVVDTYIDWFDRPIETN